MVISILIDNEDLCREIQKETEGKIGSVLEKLDTFENQYIFPQRGQEQLFENVYQNRRNEECILLSRKLERRNRNGKVQIVFNDQEYQQKMAELLKMMAEESDDLYEILCQNGKFTGGNYLLRYYSGREIRNVDSAEKIKRAFIIFGNSIGNEKEFAEHIVKVYDGLYFDKEIEASLCKLEAGIKVRRGEILYHLYCIEAEIPEILKEDSNLENRSLGERMTVPCSPERSRDTVKNELTKKADADGKIKCELHTKMKKIGNRKPDRIYFCAKVPEGIKLNGESMDGKIYIYKITEHAGGK